MGSMQVTLPLPVRCNPAARRLSSTRLKAPPVHRHLSHKKSYAILHSSFIYLFYLSPNTLARIPTFLPFLAEAAHSADLASACFTL